MVLLNEIIIFEFQIDTGKQISSIIRKKRIINDILFLFAVKKYIYKINLQMSLINDHYFSKNNGNK